MANTLYYGDNLRILREHIPVDSVDLIYLDPPFNSNRTYNVLFKERSGEAPPAQIEAFTDTWTWDRAAERQYDELVIDGPPNVSEVIGALRQFIGSNDMMAYLVMMAARLVDLHRVLKPTGSLYLHCDPTASHYLKILLDAAFGVRNFRNEIVWRRYGAHNDVGQGSHHFGRVHDVILVYTKIDSPTWNQLYRPLSADYIGSTYRNVEPETGRRFATTPLTGPGGEAKGNPVFEWNGHTRAWRYSKATMQRLHDEGRLHYSRTGYVRQKLFLEESKGVPIQDWWDDIPSLSGAHEERLGYPTQKPLALLERIINASSNPGNVVLDPFCGCGTAVIAAQKLGRQWIGIDVTHLAITLIKNRLTDSFPGIEFEVKGEPTDEGAARMLAEADRYQFQWWALSLVHAKPAEGKEKKGADRGIDGVIVFIDDASHKPKRCLVQVKSGGVKSGDMRDLVGTLQRESAALGLFVTLDAPSRAMTKEAVEAGYYDSPSWGRQFPKVQIITIDELLSGRKPDLPPARQTFQQAPVIGEQSSQRVLDFSDI